MANYYKYYFYHEEDEGETVNLYAKYAEEDGFVQIHSDVSVDLGVKTEVGEEPYYQFDVTLNVNNELPNHSGNYIGILPLDPKHPTVYSGTNLPYGSRAALATQIAEFGATSKVKVAVAALDAASTQNDPTSTTRLISARSSWGSTPSSSWTAYVNVVMDPSSNEQTLLTTIAATLPASLPTPTRYGTELPSNMTNAQVWLFRALWTFAWYVNGALPYDP